VSVKAPGLSEPLPLDIAQRGGRPLVFRAEVLVEGRNSDGFAISRVIFLMDGAGRRQEHARAGWEKWRVVDSLVKFFQEFFGVLF
jgi:DNA polymerase IIIc chi subunit